VISCFISKKAILLCLCSVCAVVILSFICTCFGHRVG
jgi:hypothetical protein